MQTNIYIYKTSCFPPLQDHEKDLDAYDNSESESSDDEESGSDAEIRGKDIEGQPETSSTEVPNAHPRSPSPGSRPIFQQESETKGPGPVAPEHEEEALRLGLGNQTLSRLYI